MRVSDLVPWRGIRQDQPARQDDRDPVGALQNDVNRAFDNFMRLFPMPLAGWAVSPVNNANDFSVDVVETDKEVRVTAELPGMEEDDTSVEIGDGILKISGEKQIDREVDENGYLLRERSFGRMERTLPLPDDVDADAAQATFKNGVLTVTIPKTSQAKADVKRVSIRSH